MISEEQKVQYTSYSDLQDPKIHHLLVQGILQGLHSKDWKKQFESLTFLRQFNKFNQNEFTNTILPLTFQQICQQVANLRSNNSKEALCLLKEILIYNSIQQLQSSIVSAIIKSLFSKGSSQKKFLKVEAVQALQASTKQNNLNVLEQTCNHINSTNASICELAMNCFQKYIQNNPKMQIKGFMIKTIACQLKGKRAILQKKSKEIIQYLKNSRGQENVEHWIVIAHLQKDQQNMLRQAFKKDNSKNKKTSSFRDFLQKKQNIQSN